MPADPNDRKIILSKPSELGTHVLGQSSIVSSMTEGVIAFAKNKEVSQARYKVGKFELARTDYEAVLLWSRELSIAPAKIMEILATNNAPVDVEDDKDGIFLRIENGRFVSLVWNFAQLPITTVSWCDSLALEQLKCIGEYKIKDCLLKPKIQSLQELKAYKIGLIAIDLQGVPNLASFNCGKNRLTNLDLSPVPALTYLSCAENQLTDLDLTPVPALTLLYCETNQIMELDLTPVPALTKLCCGRNQLTELDLTPVPALTVLICWTNQITELDLTLVPGLTKLRYSGNPISRIYISSKTNRDILKDLSPDVLVINREIDEA